MALGKIPFSKQHLRRHVPEHGEELPRLIREITGPALEARRLLVRNQSIAWSDWVDAWDREQAGVELVQPLLPGVRLLP